MSQKRKHETTDGDSAAAKHFKKQRSFKPSGSQPDKKRRRPQVSQDIEKGTSNNALKSRIRDLKRLLAHVDHVGDHKMSASTRIERERELEACEHELAENLESSREAAYKQKMISKYHQVRFFDRQKASRILKRLKKEHDSEDDQAKKHELRMKVHNAEVDVNYAIYYPLLKPYSSLYPKSKKAKVDESPDEDVDSQDESRTPENGPKGDTQMWSAIEKAMEEGTLNVLRYSKDDLPAAPVKKDNKKKQAQSKEPKEQFKVVEGKNRRERRAHMAQQEEEDSDGGFFE
ncbi:hypothetical protein ACN47E_001811 [Coniothyrium glycines]